MAVFFWRFKSSDREKGSALKQTGKILLFLVVAGTLIARAELPDAAPSGKKTASDNPVAAVRDARSWEHGPFVNWGTGVGDRSDYKFFWGGFQLGKAITPVLHAGKLSGQFELGGNIMPLWQAYTPPPHDQTFFYTGGNCPTGQTCSYVAPEGGGTFRRGKPYARDFSLELSYHFKAHSAVVSGRRWAHLYHPQVSAGSTGSQGNAGRHVGLELFSAGRFGVHYFVHPRRSIDLGVNAVHISSASLGDKNPGVNASIQIQVGFTYWK